MSWMGRKSKKEGIYVYVYVWLIRFDIKQLYLNKN